MSDMRNLIDKLNKYTKAYDEGSPIISDKEWDDLYFQLKTLEDKEDIIYPDSPTQKISYDTVNALNKVQHDHPMLSLDKSKNIEDIKRFCKDQMVIGMFKMDGLTCSLTYENGVLTKAETRGDGIVGEDILHNAKVVKNIPLTIPLTNKVVVDGEIICRKDDFIPFANEYKNPRNFAAGSIRLLSSKECAARNLSFIAWDLIEGFDCTYFYQKLTYLKNFLGFETVPWTSIWKPANKAAEEVAIKIEKAKEKLAEFKGEAYGIGLLINQLNAKAEHDIYPIDGYVFKFDNIVYGESLGRTDHHFKNAIAYKMYDEEYETRLLGIDYDISRQGILTPVAVFKPVEMDGSIVERASLSNLSIMEETLGKYPIKNQTIWVTKRNMIIPKVERAEKNDELNENVIPDAILPICPVCGQPTVTKIAESGVKTLWCSNENCDGKFINKLDHYCGKKGFDIKGLSKATLEKLVNWGWVESYADLYKLNDYAVEWKNKPGFGEASVTKILRAVNESRKCTLEAVIASLGIPLVGRTIAKDLTKRFKTYDAFRRAINDGYNFYNLDNYGIETHKALSTFDYSEMDEIVKNYLFIEEPEEEVKEVSNTLDNIKVCITGSLTIYKNRAELQKAIEAAGGKVVTSVTKNTNYLINNDINSTSAKNKAAKTLGIPILTEENFIEKFLKS